MEELNKIQGFKINSAGYGTIPKLVMQDRNLHAMAKALYAYFCSYTGAGNTCFPSRSKICYDLDISIDTFTKYLRDLVSYGYVEVKQVKDNGKFSYNLYTLLDTVIPCPKISDTGNPPCRESTVSEITVYGKTDTNNNSLKKNSVIKNNNIKKESKKERKKEFTRDGEEVSPPPSDGNSSDNYQKLPSKIKILYNSDQKKSFVEFDSLGKQSNNNSDDSLIADESKKERKKVPAKKKEKPKREITKTFDDILDCYTSNHDIKDALVEFIKMRQRIRRPLTNRALALNLEKLNELASDDSEKLKIVQQTIMNSWQSFYGINDFGKFKKKSPSYDLEKYKEESNQIKKDYGDSYTMTIGWGDD